WIQGKQSFFLLFIYMYFLLRLFLYPKEKIQFSKFIIVIVSLILLSSFWSDNILHSLKLSITQILLPVLVIVFFSNRYKFITMLRTTFISGVIITILSFIIVLLFPDLG